MPASIENEILTIWEKYLGTRANAESGQCCWGDLADFFTVDAEFYDSAWGLHKGRERIRQFLADSMVGLEGWRFPQRWVMVDGCRLVTRWFNQLPGRRPDGSYYEVPATTTMVYAGDGLFSREEDLYDMQHLLEVIGESKWLPGEGFNPPPRQVVRPSW